MPITGDVERWVAEVEKLTRPVRVHWCDGSEPERERITDQMRSAGTLIPLDPETHPNSYLYRSDPNDVARTERQTYVCSRSRDDAGPTNNWMDPVEAKRTVGKLFDGIMAGRTLYVVPYVMGPAGSPFSRIGVEITDSPYVVLSMRIMTRMGDVARGAFSSADQFCAGLHSVGNLDPEKRYILHFPEERLIWSFGSGYGGNALLGKKCFALRIASAAARDEGWLAEHMLILGLEDPSGEVTYITAAFPSACGKTNLAMLVSPFTKRGYRVWTVGDDIAWMHPGPDGRLWAVNPEAGFFGVAPGTGAATNPNAIETVNRNTIFTNVALTPDRMPWWEGIGGAPPVGMIDWLGHPHDPASGRPAAHPNARFAAPARQCPALSPRWEDPRGVPISAILFGGRRARLTPLVAQSFDWAHGVYMGAAMASETTAAAEGKVGLTRRDPMAMLPFCGYHMGDYFRHWLTFGTRLTKPPAIFSVNWFRRGADGKFLWPGFGQNIRVLMWILDRVRGKVGAIDTPVGRIPLSEDLLLDGIDMPKSALDQLFSIDRESWTAELAEQLKFFDTLKDRLPPEIARQHQAMADRLERA